MDRVRVIRVLEYVGTREWIEELFKTRCVRGYLNMEGGGIIREAVVGDFPEIVGKSQPYQVQRNLTAQEMKFMQRFGWEFHGGPSGEEQLFTKRDPQTGKVLAHEGDETWDRDLKVAGE